MSMTPPSINDLAHDKGLDPVGELVELTLDDGFHDVATLGAHTGATNDRIYDYLEALP